MTVLQAWIGCRRVKDEWLWVSSDQECKSSLTMTPEQGHWYSIVNIDMIAEFTPVPSDHLRESFICEVKPSP